MTYPITSADPLAVPVTPAEPAAPMAPTIRFTRPGKRPLSFSGSELAMAMSFTPDLPYWYEVNIFRTDQQKFVLAVKLFYQSNEETDTVKAWEFDTLPEVFDALEAYDAGIDIRLSGSMVPGMPPAELAAMAWDLTARLAAQRTHFSTLVGELFEELEAAGQTVA